MQRTTHHSSPRGGRPGRCPGAVAPPMGLLLGFALLLAGAPPAHAEYVFEVKGDVGFGSQPVGSGTVHHFVMQNGFRDDPGETGPIDISVTAVLSSIDDPEDQSQHCTGDFAVSSQSQPNGSILLPGGSVAFDIIFTPTAVGSRCSWLLVRQRTSDGGTRTAFGYLTGEGLCVSPAPTLTNVAVSTPQLWPPNHRLVAVEVGYTASDPCGTPACQLSVTSSEPDNGLGDGDTAGDIQIVDAHHVMLRAERSGNGSGRVYTITITCTNSVGLSSQATTTVTVPKSQRP